MIWPRIKAASGLEITSFSKLRWDILSLAIATRSMYGVVCDATLVDTRQDIVVLAEARRYGESSKNGNLRTELLRRACIVAFTRNKGVRIIIGKRDAFPAWAAMVVFANIRGSRRAIGILTKVKSRDAAESKWNEFLLCARSIGQVDGVGKGENWNN